MQQTLDKMKQDVGLTARICPTRESASPDRLVHPMLRLQQQAGNQAVRELMRAGFIQAKPTIDNRQDQEEREADRVADQVIHADEGHSKPGPCPCILASGELCEECKQKQATIQRRATEGNQSAAKPGIVSDVLRSPGQPLDGDTQAFFESQFGRDLGHVRVHTGSRAAASSKALNALAYTVGNNVVFGSQKYAPHSPEGRKLIAHELTHVFQQGSDRPSAKTYSVQRTPDDNTTPASPFREGQVACVVRLGGCPSSRDGGIPDSEEIKNYNSQCRTTTHYAGPDIYPTSEECANPPNEPLTTGEKIFLGALLVGAAAVAVAAVIVAGAEILPIVIAGVGEASTSTMAFYFANAIVVNDVGLFVAGLLMACEGDVGGLLRAMANDPTQAAALLAEVYILHVNIKVANGPVKRASVPVQLLPPEEQTDPQHIKFKTVGSAQFEEAEPTTPGGAPKPGQVSPGVVKGIGPPYATLEEVDALIRGGDIRSDAHVLRGNGERPKGQNYRPLVRDQRTRSWYGTSQVVRAHRTESTRSDRGNEPGTGLDYRVCR